MDILSLRVERQNALTQPEFAQAPNVLAGNQIENSAHIGAGVRGLQVVDIAMVQIFVKGKYVLIDVLKKQKGLIRDHNVGATICINELRP